MNNIIAYHQLPMPISLKSISSIYSNVNSQKIKDAEKSYPFFECMYLHKSYSPHKIIINDKTFSLIEGQLIFLSPNSRHYALPSDSVISMFAFNVDFSEMDTLCGRIITLDGRQKQMIEQVIATGSRLLEPIRPQGYNVGLALHSRSNTFELQKFKNLFELFLIDLHLKDTNNSGTTIYRFTDDEKLDKVISILKRNIDKPLTLKELSDKTYISVAKIQKLFYEKHTCAPMQYFNQLKIEAAIELISNTTLTYSEIASQLGFHSAAYFSRIFKKKTGMSPSEYTKSLQRK